MTQHRKLKNKQHEPHLDDKLKEIRLAKSFFFNSYVEGFKQSHTGDSFEERKESSIVLLLPNI